jgi:hypothetical protein
MKLSRLVLPIVMLAVLPAANMIATASSASGEPPKAQLAQLRPVGPEPAQFDFGPSGPGEHGMPHGRLSGPPSGLFAMSGPAGMRASPKAFCEGRIHVEAGIRAHLRSRLKLDPGQREAWVRMEALVEPIDLRARELCATLPAEVAGPPAAPEKLAFAEKQIGLRLEMVKALQTPFREFYQTLTAEQRAVLDRPPMMR